MIARQVDGSLTRVGIDCLPHSKGYKMHMNPPWARRNHGGLDRNVEQEIGDRIKGCIFLFYL